MKSHILPTIGLLLVTAACGHTHQFNPAPPVGALDSSPVTGRRLAIDLSNTPETFSDAAGGHKFEIVGIRAHAGHIAKSLFKNETIVATPAEAEIVLALSMAFSLKTAALGATCTCNATWNITDPAGTRLGTGTAEQATSFPSMDAVGHNCEISAIQSIAAALDNAFADLGQLPPPGAAPTAAPTPTPAPEAAATPAPATPAPAPATTEPAKPNTIVGCQSDADCSGNLVCTSGICRGFTGAPAPAPTAPPAPMPAAPPPADDVCAKVSCSGHGTCIVKRGDPFCACDAGYRPDKHGVNCVK